MELKLRILFAPETDYKLLIVPYGIETHNRVNISDDVLTLLIVPYGIETRNFLLRRFHLCIF